jgi:peptidyl-prolyl cis-trans isomerase D
MVNIMRRYRQALLMIVTVLIIISFSWFFTDYRSGRAMDDAVGRIYDRPVRLAEFERGLRRVQLIQELGLRELAMALAGQARSEREYQSNVVFNTYVLRHEANALGLVPTEAEAIEETKKMPVFQTPNGGFDPKIYDIVVQNIGRMGFGAEAIEEVAKDNIRFQKLKALFESTISASPSLVREEYQQYNQKSEVALVRLNKDDIAKTIEVSEEDVKKAFEERKEGLKTEEMRKIRYVSFVLSEEQKKLAGPERGAAFQKLMEKANEFAIAMTEKDAKFDEVAKKVGVEVKETAEFSPSNPPPELAQARPVVQAVFTDLTLEQPNSDAIVAPPHGYYVAQLTGVTPARPQTFEEAKTNLAATLKNERVMEAMELKGKEIRTKLDTDLKAGKTLAEAAQAAGVTVETMPALALADPPKPEVKDENLVKKISAELSVGQLSEATPASTGSIIVRVEKRLPIDEAVFEKEKLKLTENLSRYHAMVAFPLWLAERRKAANVQSKLEG